MGVPDRECGLPEAVDCPTACCAPPLSGHSSSVGRCRLVPGEADCCSGDSAWLQSCCVSAGGSRGGAAILRRLGGRVHRQPRDLNGAPNRSRSALHASQVLVQGRGSGRRRWLPHLGTVFGHTEAAGLPYPALLEVVCAGFAWVAASTAMSPRNSFLIK